MIISEYPRTLTTAAIVRQACSVMRGRKQRSLRRAGQKFEEKKMCNVFSIFFPSFFHVLRNIYIFFFYKFLPFCFWNFGKPTVYRILCVEFPPPKKIQCVSGFLSQNECVWIFESCLFSSNIIDLPSFFIKRSQFIKKLMQKKCISKHNAIEN